MVAAATARGEVVALIDTYDRFDPASAAAAGVDLSRLLWVREARRCRRALKAMNLVLQAGGFGLVAFDLADVRRRRCGSFPTRPGCASRASIEGSQTVAVLLGAEHIARSPGGVTIALDRDVRVRRSNGRAHARNRRLHGLTIRPRVIPCARLARPRARRGLTSAG